MELSKEEIEFIKNLSNEMKTQSNRCTAQPYALVIRTKNTVWGFDKDYADTSSVGLIWEDSQYKYEDWNKFLSDLKDYGYNELIKEIEEENVDNFYDLDSYCNLRDYDFTITAYQEQLTADSSNGCYEGNFFLTEKSANEYIERNRHNLSSPDTYGIHLYRNPEMEKLYQIIHKLADQI